MASSGHGRRRSQHAFSHDLHPRHVERLAAYWAEALGGPSTYSDSYGDETSVVRIHSGNGPHDDMDRRAIACFDQALVDVGLADDEWLRQVRKSAQVDRVLASARAGGVAGQVGVQQVGELGRPGV